MPMMLMFASPFLKVAKHLNSFASRRGRVIFTGRVYQRHIGILTTDFDSLLASNFD